MNRTFFKENWLTMLIAAQPVLDIIAFFFNNSVATVAGFIRLVILAALPIALLIKSRNKKRLIISLSVVGIFCLLHILNGFRVGYMNIFSDVHYLLKVISAPVYAICFIHVILEPGMLDKALKGIKLAIVLYLSALALSVITGTGTSTYTGGVGISGWVIDGNRCANSIILVTYCVFLMYYAAESDKKLVNVIIPVAVVFLLLSNGTKACYVTALGLMAAHFGFHVFDAVILKRRLRLITIVLTLVLTVSSVLIYPYTPRAEQDRNERAGQGAKISEQFIAEMHELGYNLNDMTLEEKLSDNFVVEKFRLFYYRFFSPRLLDEYDIKRILVRFDATTDAEILADCRLVKRVYAEFIFEDSDFLTKLVGFEFENIGKDAEVLDLENDWHAILYYYGYIGLGMYALFLLYFLYLVIKALISDFKNSFTVFNFSLFMCLVLHIFLAHFSGALLRRPNVSFFLAVVLAMIYFQTKGKVPYENET